MGRSAPPSARPGELAPRAVPGATCEHGDGRVVRGSWSVTSDERASWEGLHVGVPGYPVVMPLLWFPDATTGEPTMLDGDEPDVAYFNQAGWLAYVRRVNDTAAAPASRDEVPRHAA